MFQDNGNAVAAASATPARLPLSLYLVVRPPQSSPRLIITLTQPAQGLVFLSLERLFYGVVWHRPKAVAKLAKELNKEGQEPEFILSAVSMFKLVQIAVFGAWYYLHFGVGVPPNMPTVPVALLSLAALAWGQVLNLFVWYRIGTNGVCYGIKYGRSVPWCTQFPYSVMQHPQYTGAILTVWGMFGLLASSAPKDWFAIPLMETGLYVLSMRVLEADVALPPGKFKDFVEYYSRKLKVL
jgi:methylene-fatty-acyl-phospholipid synthase